MKVYFEFDDRKAGLKIIAKNYLYWVRCVWLWVELQAPALCT